MYESRIEYNPNNHIFPACKHAEQLSKRTHTYTLDLNQFKGLTINYGPGLIKIGSGVQYLHTIIQGLLYRWTEHSADFFLKKCPLGELGK